MALLKIKVVGSETLGTFTPETDPTYTSVVGKIRRLVLLYFMTPSILLEDEKVSHLNELAATYSSVREDLGPLFDLASIDPAAAGAASSVRAVFNNLSKLLPFSTSGPADAVLANESRGGVTWNGSNPNQCYRFICDSIDTLGIEMSRLIPGQNAAKAFSAVKLSGIMALSADTLRSYLASSQLNGQTRGSHDGVSTRPDPILANWISILSKQTSDTAQPFLARAIEASVSKLISETPVADIVKLTSAIHQLGTASATNSTRGSRTGHQTLISRFASSVLSRLSRDGSHLLLPVLR